MNPPTLTPLQHQRQLGRLIMPLMYVLNSGLETIGEAQLADLSNQNQETCRLQLRRLAAYGYLERAARYHGYRLTPLAYEVLPQRGNSAPTQPADLPRSCPPACGSPIPAVAQPAPAARPYLPAYDLAIPMLHPPAGAAVPSAYPPPAAPDPANSALPALHHPPAAAVPDSPDRGEPALAVPQRGNSALAPGVNGDGCNDTLLYKNKNINHSVSQQSPIPPDPCAGEPHTAGEDASPAEDEEQEAAWDEDDEFEVDDTPRSPEETREAWRMLRSLGIGEPTRSRLLDLSWVTTDFITAWVESLDDFPGPDKWNTGLLILRLRSEEWPPIPRRSRSRRSYTEGEFADFIDH